MSEGTLFLGIFLDYYLMEQAGNKILLSDYNFKVKILCSTYL